MAHLLDVIDEGDLAQGIDDGFIRERSYPERGLSILNYTDQAQYTPGAWDNPAVRQCRGLIFDYYTQEVIARPWAKFFNYGQKEAAHIALDEPVTVMDKLDGSLGIVYRWDGGLHVATRGSFASDQAIHATAWLRGRPGLLDRPEMLATLTPLFEIIYPENRIVCDYGERDELVLLGAVSIHSGRTVTPMEAAGLIGWGGALAGTFEASTLAEALAIEPRPGREGIVVMAATQKQALVKIKQEDYIHLHRIVTGLNERAVWERMMAGDNIETVLNGIPDELHEWVRKVHDSLAASAHRIELTAQCVHADLLGKCGSVDVSRKEYARLAQQHPDLRPYLFMLLDGKDISKAVLKSLRPEGDKRPTGARKEAA